MGKVSISMSDAMEKFVADRVESGDYNNTSEYFRELVRWDQEKRAAEDKLRKMIEKALAGGISPRTAEEIWAAGEAKALAKRRSRA